MCCQNKSNSNISMRAFNLLNLVSFLYDDYSSRWSQFGVLFSGEDFNRDKECNKFRISFV